ncbi:MAG: molybdenum cofactor guanylyltransferase [Planctomyces sp.]|nr:molybdenum cofactor guanylyltransferase [Planctomyces sp.]
MSGLACGGVVLCGGRSRRMGQPKLALPIGDEALLQRVVRIIGGEASPVVVVAAQDQELPALPGDVDVLRDEQPDLGPLGGIAQGLERLAGRGVEAAWISACDTPLLQPAFLRRVLSSLGDFELAVAREAGFVHPLAGVYRTSLAPRARALLSAGRMRPLFLIEESRSRLLDVEELRSVDPELLSLRNANTPEEYAALARLAGNSAAGR